MTPEQTAARNDAFAPKYWPRPEVLYGFVLLVLSERSLAEYTTQRDRRVYASYGQTAGEDHFEQNLKSARALRCAHASSLIYLFACIAIGCFLGRIIGGNSLMAADWVALGAAGILLWATLALGYSTKTMTGITLLEELDFWGYRLLYVVGTGALAFVVSLQAGRSH